MLVKTPISLPVATAADSVGPILGRTLAVPGQLCAHRQPPPAGSRIRKRGAESGSRTRTRLPSSVF